MTNSAVAHVRPHLNRTFPLRVGFVGKNPNAPDAGGGEIQMRKTAESLRQCGATVRMLHRLDDLHEIDALHCFDSHREHLAWVETARQLAVPSFVSTVAWFALASYWNDAESLLKKLSASGRFLTRLACPRIPSWRRRLYHAADRLLPNSRAEERQLVRLFQVPKSSIHVVPNATDLRFADANPRLFVERFGLQGFVLCPGRIEPRKNQLGLIRALKNEPIPLVILGRTVPGHKKYAAQCRSEASEGTRFIDALSHDDPCLASAYAACGCLALVSRFETPGLVALEAGLTGTPLLLTEGGATREYFGEFARYVNPSRPSEIRRAILRALGAPRSPALAEHIRKRYTWNETARVTLNAYHELAGVAVRAAVENRKAV